MQTGQESTGMQTMNQSLVGLVRAGLLSKADSLEYSFMPDELTKMLVQVQEKK
jgi:Tfp pilus assembly pilus retraction ATPase PilT